MEHSRELYFALDLVAFLATLSLHLVKTNRNLIRLYLLQSLVVVSFLLTIGLAEGDRGLVIVALLSGLIKVVIAPLFFARLIRRYGTRFTTNNYLSTPLTLTALMGLVLFSYSSIFLPLGMLVPSAFGILPLNLAMILISIFMLINRRGAFSQMVGILSLENSILLLASFIGIRQPVALEMGIVFDIVIWMIIAQVFISMIYRQFGTLSVDKMKRLIED
jgi:hydrogenase-4 component E